MVFVPGRNPKVYITNATRRWTADLFQQHRFIKLLTRYIQKGKAAPFIFEKFKSNNMQ